ncbi:MAG: hypothetical protein FJ265_14120 [Planctomycetes bacterium]|nr:hypothetical protein [Planctomycetota bacterium]
MTRPSCCPNRARWSLAAAALAAACATAPRPLVDFAAPDTRARFTFTDPAAFRWIEADGQPCLELFAAARYQPPHRSPLAIALLREPQLGDFTLRVEASQTGREYPHRDLVLVFAYRDPAHFAYAHLASKGDATAHHVMLVDGKDRRPVTTHRTEGVAWGNGWHRLELRRDGTRVEVRFDGELALAGEVPAWRGAAGLGSFDDTGRFRALAIVPR